MKDSGVLTAQQLQGLQHAEKKASMLSSATEATLLARVQQLGFTRSDLIKTLAFIRDRAPIVVHLSLDDPDHSGIIRPHPILDDSHYRCGPELRGASEGRVGAEERLFGAAYGHSMKAADRVKYGALNLTADPTGVASAHGYGDSFLLLRNETVRARITITSTDSYSPCVVGTCESFAHVLDARCDDGMGTGSQAAVADAELTNLIKVAIGEARHAGSHRQNWMYKEVQIHGPLDLRRDVACLFVNRRHKKDADLMKRIEAFRARNKCEVVIMENANGEQDMDDEEDDDNAHEEEEEDEEEDEED